jgi:hypothetical protein
MHGRIAISSSTERRIRREARSETLRERALALRRAGWTLASIGTALGVSTTRALQMVRKAERLIAERVAERDASSNNEPGAPVWERPLDSNDDPLAAGRNELEQRAWLYTPPAT